MESVKKCPTKLEELTARLKVLRAEKVECQERLRAVDDEIVVVRQRIVDVVDKGQMELFG